MKEPGGGGVRKWSENLCSENQFLCLFDSIRRKFCSLNLLLWVCFFSHFASNKNMQQQMSSTTIQVYLNILNIKRILREGCIHFGGIFYAQNLYLLPFFFFFEKHVTSFPFLLLFAA